MKLDKYQIAALANAVKEKKEKEAKKFNADLRKDKKVIAEAKRIIATINKLPEDVKVHLRDHSRNKTIVTMDNVIERLINSKKKKDYYNTYPIEQQIVIATIDANDMDELKKKIGLDI